MSNHRDKEENEIGRKIPRQYENWFDNILIDIAEIISEPLHKLGFVPNTITFISFLLTLLSVYLIKKDRLFEAVIVYISGYLCDCLDGYMARKYNQETQLGDWLDHLTDIIGILLIVYIMIKKNISIRGLIVLAVSFLLSMFHVGCTEYYLLLNNKTNSESLRFTKNICPIFKENINITDVKRTINITKFFGLGNFILTIAFVIYNIKSL